MKSHPNNMTQILPPPIYRAERLTQPLLSGEAQRPRSGTRLPSNVPYVLDNLWEYLRPEHMPSRRRAIYASPTRELAMANCSASGGDLGFCVYELQIDGAFKMAQLGIKDARDHADRRRLMKLVQDGVEALRSASDDERRSMGMLFLPAASRDDWVRARAASSMAAAFIEQATALSTFWADASPRPNGSDGEFFLELPDGTAYTPKDLQRY